MASTEMEGYFNTTLAQSAKTGNTRILQQMVKKIGEVNAISDDEGKTPLDMAAENGNRAAVNLLVNAGADVNKSFIAALTNTDDRALDILLETGADVNIV